MTATIAGHTNRWVISRLWTCFHNPDPLVLAGPDNGEAYTGTVYNVRNKANKQGWQEALEEQPRQGRPPEISGEARAEITALACADPPEGYARWSFRLLADRAVEFGFVASISHEAVREILKKTSSNPT